MAEVHSKRHDDLLRLIRNRVADAGEWGLRNFAESSYVNEQGKVRYCRQPAIVGKPSDTVVCNIAQGSSRRMLASKLV